MEGCLGSSSLRLASSLKGGRKQGGKQGGKEGREIVNENSEIVDENKSVLSNDRVPQPIALVTDFPFIRRTESVHAQRATFNMTHNSDFFNRSTPYNQWEKADCSRCDNQWKTAHCQWKTAHWQRQVPRRPAGDFREHEANTPNDTIPVKREAAERIAQARKTCTPRCPIQKPSTGDSIEQAGVTMDASSSVNPGSIAQQYIEMKATSQVTARSTSPTNAERPEYDAEYRLRSETPRNWAPKKEEVVMCMGFACRVIAIDCASQRPAYIILTPDGTEVRIELRH